MSQAEKDAERVMRLGFDNFVNQWNKVSKQYSSSAEGTPAALLLLERCVESAARELGVTGGATLWAQDKAVDMLQEVIRIKEDRGR